MLGIPFLTWDDDCNLGCQQTLKKITKNIKDFQSVKNCQVPRSANLTQVVITDSNFKLPLNKNVLKIQNYLLSHDYKFNHISVSF